LPSKLNEGNIFLNKVMCTGLQEKLAIFSGKAKVEELDMNYI